MKLGDLQSFVDMEPFVDIPAKTNGCKGINNGC
jgi:hypothetical protein